MLRKVGLVCAADVFGEKRKTTKAGITVASLLVAVNVRGSGWHLCRNIRDALC